MPNEVTNYDAPDDAPADDSETPGYTPVGYESADAFLTYVREEFDADAGYDKENRDMALEDLKFLAGDQWDAKAKKDREAKGRPCLTINVLPQFVGQVIGDRRMNKTSIKVAPKKDGTSAEAEVRSGIIKGIEERSRADRVYDAACEDQVGCGIGNFRIDLEYAANDAFDQDIVIRHIPNPLAVVWDRMSVDPTGRDARHCFVQDVMPRKIYDKRFPKHPAPSELGDGAAIMTSGWFDQDIVRLTEFWEMTDKPALIALMKDGDVKDVTGKPLEEYKDELWTHPQTGKTKVRKTVRTYARMHLVTGFAILTEAYELPLDRLPIIKVEGRVIRVGDDRVRFGLVRYAKDSQRLKNYWRSVAAETLALAPKAQWTAGEDAVEGREDEWRTAHLTGDPLLIHNKDSEAPQRVDPPAVPAALVNESQMNQQDIKDTTGLQDASLGMRSNEISGRAIGLRQKEGDIATIIYHDNLNASILEGGDVVNQLLPIAYDSTRMVLHIGPDDKRLLMTINDPNDDKCVAISKTRYDVSLTTGPSFTTQREEAREAMTTLIQTAPDLFTVAGDLIVKNMDWPGAHEISERLKAMMQKQGILPPEEQDPNVPPPEPSPEEQAAAALQEAQLHDAAAQLEHAQALRQAEMARTEAETLQAQIKVEETKANLVAAKANAMSATANAKGAAAKAKIAEQDARISPIERAHKMHLAERTASAKSQSTQGGADGGKGKAKPPRKGK